MMNSKCWTLQSLGLLNQTIVEDGGDFWGKSETVYQDISETLYIYIYVFIYLLNKMWHVSNYVESK